MSGDSKKTMKKTINRFGWKYWSNKKRTLKQVIESMTNQEEKKNEELIKKLKGMSSFEQLEILKSLGYTSFKDAREKGLAV